MGLERRIRRSKKEPFPMSFRFDAETSWKLKVLAEYYGASQANIIEELLDEKYEQVLQEQPDHADARHNADLIRKLLEQQQQQQQAQNSSGQDHQGSQDPQSSSPGSEGEDGQEPPSQSSPEVAEPTSAQQGQAEQSAQGADLSTEEKQSREGRTDSAKDQESQELAHDDQSPPQNSVPRPRDPKSELPEHEQAQMVQGLPASKEDQEERQALEQWLRRIPDDPGGLLRRKFMLEHQRRGKVNQGVGQSW